MSDGTKIEWTDATWNVVNGCSVVSPGCANCYAMKQAHRVDCRRGLTRKTNGGMVWTGEVRFNHKVLLDPLRWRRPRRIFVCAHGDLFHEKVPDEWIDKVFAVMALAPQHTFQVLTKRPERMREYLTLKADERNIPTVGFKLGRGGRIWEKAFAIAADDLRREKTFTEALRGQAMTTHEVPWPLTNIWLGTSVEDQKRADERVPVLLDTPAAVRWLSCEPLLGPVDLGAVRYQGDRGYFLDVLEARYATTPPRGGGNIFSHGLAGLGRINWVIAGGESGPNARPMHPDWARSLRDQCADAGVPFLFKQWGEWAPREAALEHLGSDYDPDNTVELAKLGKKAAGRLLDGAQHDGYPA